jgi:glycosyltransferase involved in cell wall biosynthesis
MPKVSIIMGIYNCKNFELLDKSVSSILNQSFTDFEFIICNDGSTNGTLDYLRKIEKLDGRIRVISYEKNQGLNFALNSCLNEAKCEYIARQDDDDISRPNRLEKEVEFLDKNQDYAIVGTLADVFDDSGVWGKYDNPERPTKNDFYWNSPFMHPTIMIRKTAYDAVNGYRIAYETRRCEDIDLFMRMYTAGFKGYNIQEKLYSYRMLNDPDVKYRPMKYRIDEAIVKYKGYKAMGNLLGGLSYMVKPIIVGLIPQKLLYQIKKRRYRK